VPRYLQYSPAGGGERIAHGLLRLP
jgi:hypothetical protein